MKKVLLTATVQSHICQFHRPLVEVLHEKGYEVHIAAKNNLAEKNGLFLDFVEKVYDVPFSRSPKSSQNIEAYRQLKKIINENNYDLIYCNTPVAGILTRLAARNIRKHGTKVVYTAHGFHFYKGAPLVNWMIYYPIELVMTHFTDAIITINSEDYSLAKEKMKRCQVEYIPGVGVDIKTFSSAIGNGKELRQQMGINEDSFVVISVGELNKNKNQQLVIKAISLLNNPNVHFAIVGNGPNKNKLETLAKELNIENQVHFLGYRRDVGYLYKSSNVCTFSSIREGLGLACIEAIATGIPAIATRTRGTSDIIVSGENGLLLENNDVEGFAESLKQLYNYEEKLIKLSEEDRMTSVNKFDVSFVKEKHRSIIKSLENY